MDRQLVQFHTFHCHKGILQTDTVSSSNSNSVCRLYKCVFYVSKD